MQNIVYIQVDVASVTSIKEGFEHLQQVLTECGEVCGGLDLLVNNAGITRDNLALRLSEEDWDRVLDINLKGAFFCSQQALKLFVKKPISYLINISSIVGRTGNPGQANYAASKAGLIALTKTLALEYASRNVLVNAIAPGFIDTAMTQKLPDTLKQKILAQIPLGRFAGPSDIASIVSFLSSGQADYITGQVIEVTGGLAL
jgi:3-oxoacyl-[acyl-carrier protein] reductase